MTIDHTVGIIAHLPLNAILKGERGVEFELVAVDLYEASGAASDLYDLVSLDLSDDFTTIAPAPSPAGDAPDAATHGNAATSVEHGAPAEGHKPAGAPDTPTLADWAADINANPAGGNLDTEAHTIIVDTIRAHRDGVSTTTQPADSADRADIDTPTLDELRAEARQWTDADRAELVAYFDRNDTDRTDATQVAEAMRAVRFFIDVTSEPVERPEVAAPPAPPRRTEPDEGDPLEDIDVEAAGERYLRLTDDVRSWVFECGSKARIRGPYGQATRRRFDILRGLCNLAEAGFDSDDMVRAVLAHIIHSHEAWQAPHTVADVLATLDAAEASRFAAAADAVAGRADVSLKYTLEGRAVLEPSVVAEVAA